MNSGGAIDEWMSIDETDCCFEIGRPIAGSDREDIFQAGLAGAFDDSSAVVIELRVIKMAVRIDELQKATRLPRMDWGGCG
jgi:hypothetical protein